MNKGDLKREISREHARWVREMRRFREFDDKFLRGVVYGLKLAKLIIAKHCALP